ncbi:Embryogenesis-associated protein EMB8 [Dichanthelium oligosanthes]|uniref:Embryogenesis-associated protein EMB8 n=1 Tax=Dichanthelium oligosanthes TaxID=888268 RepID=A0A1E5W764_9POAL|nr:Embryogenesis-associated protein EMB8 [Dichanthelium oligosanthes]
MAAAAPTPSPFVASTRRFAPRLRSFLPPAAMSSAAFSAPNPSSGAGEETHAPPLPHSTLEIAGARRGLLSGFASLRAPYRAFPVLASNRHVETIFAAFTRSRPAVRLRRECLRAPDDGAVALDWVSGDDSALPRDAPVLILLPGLTGGSDDTYVRHMLMRARSKEWRVVVFNSRGCADSPVTTPKFYSASFTGDLRQVVGHVLGRYPQSNVYAVGWSLGANILVRYLGTCSNFRHALLFEGLEGEYDIPKAASARTVRDFDEGLTRVSFGFKSVDDYYSNSSSSDSIKNVCIPLLCIQADNDPIAPSRGIPREDIKESCSLLFQANPNCLLLVTPKGGHLGWVAGDEAPFGCPWTDPVVMEYLEYLQNENSPSTKNNISYEQQGVSEASGPHVTVNVQR